MSDDKEMAKKVPENIASFKTLMSKGSSPGASVSRYVWEEEELTKKIQDNIVSFEELKSCTYKKLKKPPKFDESLSKE